MPPTYRRAVSNRSDKSPPAGYSNSIPLSSFSSQLGQYGSVLEPEGPNRAHAKSTVVLRYRIMPAASMSILCYDMIRIRLPSSPGHTYCHQGPAGVIPRYCTHSGGFDPSHHPPLLFWAVPGTTPTTLQRVVANTTTFPGAHFWLTKVSSAKTPPKTPPNILSSRGAGAGVPEYCTRVPGTTSTVALYNTGLALITTLRLLLVLLCFRLRRGLRCPTATSLCTIKIRRRSFFWGRKQFHSRALPDNIFIF